jgi:beta-galactosidase
MIDDLKTLIMRDRNHPSVIMWSLCNEALCEGFNADTAKVLKPIVKTLDPQGQRPVTAAMNGGYGSGFQDVLDVMGVNYHIGSYDSIHKSHPNQPMIGSETSSDYSDRSIYSNDKVNNYVSAYDVNYPGWGNTAEDAWDAIASRDFISGGFYWTAFDYKGEPTPYGWPNINSHFGVIDEAGFPKDNYFYHQSVFFGPEQKPVLHLLPHWNWDQAQCQGLCSEQPQGSKSVNVWAYTNGDAVELFLNNKSLGRKVMPLRRHVSWQVPFAAGELRAVAYRNTSQETFATQTVTTTGKATAIALQTEWPIQGGLKADGTDTALVTVKLVDEAGRMVPTASAPVQISLAGPGQIIGLGNGNPSSHEHDKPDSPTNGVHTAWNGLARIVVQATKEAGQITLQTSSAGLESAQIKIPVGKQQDQIILVL